MKKTFENQWQEALSDANIPAPEGSWDWIEAELDKKKRKPVFVLWNTANLLKLAAACLVTLGIGSYIFMPKTKTDNISLNTPAEATKKGASTIKNESSKNILSENTGPKKDNAVQNVTVKPINTKENIPQVTGLQPDNLIIPKPENRISLNANKNFSALKSSSEQTETAKIFAETEEHMQIIEKSDELEMRKMETGKVELAYLTPFALEYINVKTIQKRNFLPVEELEQVAEIKSERSNRWIGLQSGNSPFSPSYNSQTLTSTYATEVDNTAAFAVKTIGSPNADAKNGNIPYEQFSGGNSRSFGLEVGKKIKKRWTIGAMVRLSNARINQRTNVFAINQKTGTVNTYFQSNYLSSADKKDQVFTSVPSENTQTFRYIQVPVYLSYQLPIFSKLDLEFQTGISNDVFLGSKLKGDIIEDVNFTSKNSKYKALNFSGLAGLGLNLKISKNWRAVVQGNFQKALFSGTKGDLDFRPRFLGVNYGLRYVIM
jgi:Outer membrane protein beta-barrel domain